MTTKNTLQQLERTADDDSSMCDENTLTEALSHPDLGRREIACDAIMDAAAGVPVSPLN